MSSGFIHVVAGVRVSFLLWLNYLLLHILSSLSAIDEHAGSFHLSAAVNNAAVNVGVLYHFETLLPVLWGDTQEWNYWVRWYFCV